MLIPITIPSNESALKGARLKSIEIFYAIGWGSRRLCHRRIDKVTLGVDDTAASGALSPIPSTPGMTPPQSARLSTQTTS